MSIRNFDSVIQELFRSTVGFDELLHSINAPTAQPSFPPYNIVATETGHAINVALAGYGQDDIEVAVDDGKLIIKTVDDIATAQDEKDSGAMQYRGISKRKFKLEYALGRKQEVTSAKLEHGMLMIDIATIESKDVKQIPIM